MKKRIGIILSALFLVIALTACGSTAEPSDTKSSTPQTAVSSQQDGSAEHIDTSVQADSIARKARDAANSATDEDISTAYEYIKANYTDCFKDSTTTEQMMYYGWLLEYKYEGDTEKQDYYTLGQNAEQLAKYVYRGSDTADSDSTKANIEQVAKSIDAIEQAKAAAEQAVAEKAADEKTVAEPSEASNSTDTASTEENSQTVYFTKSGKKYHYANPCGRGTYYPCTLAEAQARGLEPCGKCVLR